MLGAIAAAQSTPPPVVEVGLTAQRMAATMPDGKTVPMWGFCQTGSCSGVWSAGPTITVPFGSTLKVTLNNQLPTPTSFVVLGQVNGGSIGTPTKVASPAHPPQTVSTWPAQGSATFNPPIQTDRVQSFAAEASIGSTQTYTWSMPLAPGTYIYESGTNPSIQVPMGLYGVLIVTTAPTTASNVLTPGAAYPGYNVPGLQNVPYDADGVMLISEVDAVQNKAVDALCPTGCSGPLPISKYPPAVNYAPTYFLVNGKAFDQTSPTVVSVGSAASTGNVLLRFANAGSRTHIPTVVGANVQVVAEDGNILPGNPRAVSEVYLPAGKTHDAILKPIVSNSAFVPATFGVFDRALMLSNNNKEKGGAQAFVQIAGGALPAQLSVQANNDDFHVPVNSSSYTNNVLTNDIGVHQATLVAQPANGTVSLASDGTFTFTPTSGSVANTTFQYYGNGNSSLVATVHLTVTAVGASPTAVADNFSSSVGTYLYAPRPGVLGNDTDPTGYVLTAKAGNDVPAWITINPDGSIVAKPTTAPSGQVQFHYTAVNSQGTSSNSALVTLTFAQPTGLAVTLADANTKKPIGLDDYRWIIEEDQTFHNSEQLVGNGGTIANTLGVNFHRSYMPVIATGCTGPKSCAATNSYNGVPTPSYQPLTPDQVHLDPAKYYYISVLPGDSADPFIGAADFGHTMGGANINPGQTAVTILLQQNPLPPAQLSILVFNDNNPTNGDIDGAEENQGLGGFAITISDVRGSTGDPAGQMTYDAFNLPITNALQQLRPDLCPIPAVGAPPTTSVPWSPMTPYNVGDVVWDGKALQLAVQAGTSDGGAPTWNAAYNGLTVDGGVVWENHGNPSGMIYTCPEKDINGNPSPLAGHALVQNISPGRYDVFATPSADRESRGERWLQVSTLEGTPANDAFTKAGEPPYFQEFGSPGYHSFIGFVNINDLNAANAAMHGNNSIKGQIVNQHMSRPWKTTLYNGSHDPLSGSTCYIGLNAQAGSGQNVGFAQCDDDGNFVLTGVAPGAYQIVVWDQWLDQIINYHDVVVPANASGRTIDMGQISELSWFTTFSTMTFLDVDGTHKPSDANPGLGQIPFTIRFRDGSISNISATDSSGNSTWNELFPLFNWYVGESDTTRYASTGVHVVVDGGGAPDTTGEWAGILASHYPTGESSERHDPPTVLSEAFDGYISQTIRTDWGKRPYNVGENGGIMGTVVYSSTRPFDDPRYLVQNLWEPLIPRVTVNLYKETFAADGTQQLTLVNTTKSSSWDDTAPSMQCPGQDPNDPFVAQTLGTANIKRCYDGMHNFNQAQPGVYDGRYQFTTDSTGAPLKPGTYVVEVVPPAGYEIVKEEDKDILIGDAWQAPAVQQFGGLGSIFILPDQATIGSQNLGMTKGGYAFPPCVGNMHRVPDFLTLFPDSGQTAPFAGADRPLCDRKEVTLPDQAQATANFFLFTGTPAAGHYTGMILNDAASEFNANSPDFGEKLAVPFVPVSIKDFNGVEVSRVYADQWGMFNGLTPSSWQVNVPTPAGYGPNMMITCMNDPGPIPGPDGTLITDPNYNPNYSNFCYTNPFMPGGTDYLDTPVLPIAAYAGHYSQVDCAYQNNAPAIKRVDSSAGFGPYLTTAGGQLTIQATGDVQVPNPLFQGPSATAAPYNQKLITRHFGFGATRGMVRIGNANVAIASWSDQSITVNVPGGNRGGQLVVTTADGQSTVEAVNVTVEARNPIRVSSSGTGDYQTIQDAVDHANPGDLILIDAGTYPELVIMDRPVRLQGVGAASVVINAAKYPTQKLDAWRPRINTLFGADQDGNITNPALVDPLPGQEIAGGVVLLEPTVLGTEEGAGITVLAKNGTSADCQIPTNPQDATENGSKHLRNFLCAASRIDGVSVTGGDAGGGIFVNGWAHNLEISNNRVFGNAGTMNGGIRVGVPFLEGLEIPANARNNWPGFGFDKNVTLHNNAVYKNGMVEPTGGSSAAGGGISIMMGTDGYEIANNFICGNYSMGDGGGIGHIGLSNNGSIHDNKVIFNQSYQQSGSVHGGGIVVEGEPPVAGNLTLGAGNVTLDANLIQGNFAESGSGAGLRLQDVNGAEIGNVNPWTVTVTNNMIVNNTAGLAGGGIGLRDTIAATIKNNTVANNDSVSIVGTQLLPGTTTTKPNPAGIASEPISDALHAALQSARGLNLTGNQKLVALPTLFNNIVSQNRSFFFDASSGTAKVCNSNKAADATSHACTVLSQSSVGQCSANAAVWDLGVLGDTSVTGGAIKLNPTYSLLSSTADNQSLFGTGFANTLGNPQFLAPYCNGTANTNIFSGYNVALTLDEGANGIDVQFGPIWPMGDYHIGPNSAALNTATQAGAPRSDYDHDTRPQGGAYDMGADEVLAYSASPRSLVFPATQIGQTAGPLQVVISNSTASAAAITTLGIAGGNSGNFAQTNACGGTVAAHSTCVINVTFTPSAAGNRTSTLQITAGGTNLNVGLSGIGVAPSVSVTPTSLSFANTNVGQTSTLTNAITVANNGNGPLTVTSLNFAGTNAADFSRTTNCPVGGTLSVGQACAVSVTFAPSAPGTRSATLNVVTGAGTVPVAVSGIGNGAAAAVSPATLQFGSVQVGTAAATQVVTVQNTGNQPLGVSALTITGNAAANYGVVSTSCPTANTLAAGNTCTVTVGFTPSAANARNATLTLTTNGGSPAVNLRGTGVAQSSTFNDATTGQPITALAFGNVTRGQNSSQSVTLTNTGIGPLSVNLYFTGTNSAMFSRQPSASNDCGATVAVGGSCTLTIRFAPPSNTTTGAKSATATNRIGNSTSTTTSAGLALSGTAQ